LPDDIIKTLLDNISSLCTLDSITPIICQNPYLIHYHSKLLDILDGLRRTFNAMDDGKQTAKAPREAVMAGDPAVTPAENNKDDESQGVVDVGEGRITWRINFS
jgi:hypothetical protein